MNTKKSPLERILRLLKEERVEITSIYFYAIASGLIQLSLPLGIQSIISFVLGGSLSTSLVVLIILVVAGVLCTGLIYINQMKLIEKIQQKIMVRYAMQIARTLPQVNLQKTDGEYLPERVNRFFDIPVLQKGLAKLLLDIPTATIQILFGLILLSLYNAAFIIFSILLILILAALLYYSGTKGLQTSLSESKKKYRIAAWFEEVARILPAFKNSRQAIHIEKADERMIAYLKSRTEHFSVLLFQYRLLVALKTIITAAMLIVGAILLIGQQLNIGQFVAAEIVILIVIQAVEKLIGSLDSVYDSLTSVDKIGQLTDLPVENNGKFIPLKSGKGMQLEIRGLNFKFDKKTILNDFTGTASPGEKICLQGPSGSGKSTLLKILYGLYEEFEGIIIVDGTPLRNYEWNAYRSSVAAVMQSDSVFEGTLYENLTMGADIDRQKVQDYVRKLDLIPLLETLPDGYESKLDPAGHRLPGMVIRKITLARALLKEPRLLLMEEPWAGFPEHYQQRVKEILLNDFPDTTVIIASNEPGFAELCQRTWNLTTN